jgi:hypothetical protein
LNNKPKYIVKKGPADPFRGSWYKDEVIFESRLVAVSYASELSRNNYLELNDSWNEFGYEWSVFHEDEKIWEGFKYIQESLRKPDFILEIKDGYLD